MGMGEISESVEITVKTIGPAPPSRLSVSSPIKVRDLRKLIATSSANHLPIENLRLVFRGKVLDDTQDDDDRDDVYLQLSNGDSVIAAVKPKPPPRHLRDDTCIDDDDLDLKFKLPRSTSRWKRKLFFFLRNKLKLPDTSDGDFLTQSKDLGNYHFMVCLCTYCPQMGSWTFIHTWDSILYHLPKSGTASTWRHECIFYLQR
ncbi:ubiquitin-like domain-containing protein [Citrus sinensis]|uniref:Ubiquitin-like domain-containing protein n=1 Tax=Citrus clementina TaxID=85681 RepID=V4TEE6_CITCL|nr:hypothetical protein CICLE_v10032685mg [Citrus x clementina]KAH9705158.1 ubiquitin-like domain-containing protein [Citrus sinensis]